MKIDIESIKDAVYELEGLLELAELREDKLTALLPLMRNKLNIINSLFKDVETEDQEDVKGEYAEEDESFVIETGSSEAEDEISEVTEEISGEEDEFSETGDIAVEADEKIFEAEYDDYEKVSPETDSPELPLESVQESEEEDWNVIRVIAEEDEREEDHKIVRREPINKPAFCVNDRFRFRRELFNNSDADFNSAMDLVATMVDYEEAEDYFLGALGWNMERPEVADFMAIIQNYFDK